MSDDMEREINERSIARKLEEEEMKRKLTGIGIYDPGYSYTEMKELLEFVNDSQNTANITSDNKSVQERTQHSDNECLSDIISNINTQQKVASQECSEMPRPSYSYKNRMSPITHESKTVHYINSPECPVLFEARNSMHRHNSSDSDEIFEKPYDNTNSTHIMTRYGSLKSGTEKRMAQGAQDEIMQKLERWRLNPLDISIDKNDVPLKQPSRPLAQERAPFKHCKNIHKSDQCDRIICCMSQHLKDMADLWCDWRRPNINTIFQWGSPIQVGTSLQSLPYRSYR
ncbi:hypothetical protein PUN28_017160 [Cardiocondyla obscurior]|uniref:Uncharacterized protein n=1 Tax=Cardiocondyla obscurior TaxID=286306 RepID=A0AAW2EQZ6_9HYME